MMQVVGTASEPCIAREKIKHLHPLPVVLTSSLTEQGPDVTLQASAVWGRLAQAVKLAGADAVLPLGDIAPAIFKLIERSNGRTAC